MRRQRTRAQLWWPALCILLIACGSDADQTPAVAPARPELDARMSTPRTPEHADLTAALSELQAAECPATLDAALWAELAAALEQQLQAAAEGKQASVRPSGPENELQDLELVDGGPGGWRLEWTYVNVGDYDHNGEVGISDLVPVGMHFLSAEGGPDWAAAQLADGDGNGEVNIADVTPIGMHFGASCGSYNIYGRDGDSGPWTLLDSVQLSAGTGGPPRRFSWNLGAADYEHYMVAACDFGGDDRPAVPIASGDMLLLEDAGLSIDNVQGQLVTLTGDISGLEEGQLLVSGQGDGFLGRVTNINPIMGGATVSWAPAALDELFDYADVSFERALTYDMLEGFTPAIDGLTLTATDWSGTSAAGKDGSMTLAAFRVEFPESDEIIPGAKVQGALEFKLDAGLDFQVGEGWPLFGDLEYFDFNTTIEVQGEVTAKWAAKSTFANTAILLGTMRFGAIVIFAGPVPVVFTPTVDLYCGLEGTVEIGIELKPFLKLSATAGLRYDKSRGWDTYKDLDAEYSIGLTQPNLYGKVECTFNLFSPQPMFELYGIAGPYARFHAPYVKVAAQIQTTPPEFAITVNCGAKGSVGAHVAVLGHNLVDYESKELFDVVVKAYEAKWPLVQAPLTFDVEWESAFGPGVPVSNTYYDQPYLYVRKEGVGYWWVGFTQPGSLEEQPYAVWQDQTDYDLSGEAVSGTIRFTVGKLEPGIYEIGMNSPILSHSAMRVTKITLAGDHSGSYEMENGAPPANHNWHGLQYDSVNKQVTVLDQSYELEPPY